jgi:serine/threonine-protein kinase
MTTPEDELVARANARIGTVLDGKYRLDRVLGVGGMASVYAATHRNSKRVAVKMLHPELSLRSDIRARFLREGYVANQVHHAGAVGVLDDDVAEDGAAFLVMELLEGATVEALWEKHGHQLPLPAVLGIGLQVLDVLIAAHANGIVHRDLKPANLFVTTEGQVKVLDFGIARLRDAAASSATSTGLVMGTPAFMAPEQALGKTSAIDAQSDLWAVGAVLFTLASGRFIHEGESAQHIVIQAATKPAPSFATVAPWIAPELIQVVDSALAFDKGDRWATAAAMQKGLSAAAYATLGSGPSRHALVDLITGRPTPTHATRPVLAVSDSMLDTDEGEAKTRVRTQPWPEAIPESAPPAPRRPAGLTTAQPVTNYGLNSTPRRVPRPVILGAIGVAFVAAAATAGLLMGHSDGGGASTSASAARPSAVETTISPPTTVAPVQPTSISVDQLPRVPTPPAAVTPPPAVPVPSTTAPRAAATPMPEVSSSPPAPARVAAPSVAAAAPAQGSPAASKPNCDPPYRVDAQGNKKWKLECL